MNQRNSNSRLRLLGFQIGIVLKAFIFLTAVILLPISLRAQSSTTTARTPGAPVGSYSLGDTEHINLFTGNLNYQLPILSIGGRGGAQTTLGVVLENQWDARESDAGNNYVYHTISNRYPDPLALVGSLRFDVSQIQTGDVCASGPTYWFVQQGSIVYTEPNGTEHVLRSSANGSMPQYTCGFGGLYLAKQFQSKSGDFITFVADTDFYTNCWGVPNCTNSVDGYLYFANGSKSRIQAGHIMWTRDRNGNQITYEYETNPHDLTWERLKKITDTLGREVNIAYEVTEPAPYGWCTKITAKGFGGQDKVIRISRESDVEPLFRNTQPQDAIRAPLVTDDPNDNIIIQMTTGSPFWVRAIWLPDGRSYQFKYNILGQVARVDLPTGGAVEYDFADITQLPFEPSALVGSLSNRVSEKRVYNTGNVLVSKTVFTNPTSYTPGLAPTRGNTVTDVELFNPAGNRLAKSRHYFYGAPNSLYSLGVPWWHSREFRTETFDTDGTTMLRIEQRDWRQHVPTWCPYFNPCSAQSAETNPTNNTFIAATTSTIVDGNLVSRVSSINPINGTYAFDTYNNQTDVWVYGFGTGQPGGLLKHTHTSYINNANALNGIFLVGLTDTTSVYAVDPYGGETLASQSQTLYDEYPLHTYSQTVGWQDPGAVRGNPTTVKRWLDTDNSWIETHAEFDQLGNVRKTYDPLGRITQTTYTDAFTDSVDRHTFAFPTQTTSPIPDDGNLHGSNSAFVSTAVFDFNSGLVRTTTDITGQVTTFEYIDPLDRLTKVINPTGGGWTRFDYGDAIGNLHVKTTTAFDQSRNLESYTFFDGLGRNVRTFAPKGGGVWVIADTQYDAAGRVHRAAKPYEDTSLAAAVNPADHWVITLYDALGRVKQVTTADGSTVQTDYAGNTVTVTDADQKKRKTESDALGRLTRTIEDPGGLDLVSTFTYDILGNLRIVEQGQQHRYFKYDSLSRLVRSYNPEQEPNPDLAVYDAVCDNSQWSTGIVYLANGDISSKTDARGIRIDYSYDKLNRPYHRSYTATRTLPDGTYTATPPVDVYYDGRGLGLPMIPASFLGKAVRISSSNGETRYTSFDEMGRIKSSEQIIGGQTYQMPSYSYNLAGALESQVYPSGRTVQNTFDNGGKLSTVSGQLPNQTAKTYASNFDYTLTSTGATSRMQLGNGRWENVVYNNRLQPTRIGLGTTQTGTELLKVEYNYGTTNNNGNVRSQTITTPAAGSSAGFTAVQTYGYDDLNRLTSAIETSNSQPSWQQTFTYDQWGNRQVITGATTTGLIGDNPTILTANNRINPQSGEAYQYDKSGNLIRDRIGNAYAFDGENLQTVFTYSGTSQPAAQYFYDGEGRRVKKVVGSNTTIFVHDAMGKLLAEYEANPLPSSGTTYLTTDNLGTPRVTTDSSGAVQTRHDYVPYGEEIVGYGGRANHAQYQADSVRQKYTGFQRDDENGLDYAQARYYAYKAGRFNSVDPLMASASNTNPQSFNRYTYALNNPYKYTDPSGMEVDDEVDQVFAALNALIDWSDEVRKQLEDKAREEARKQQQQQSATAQHEAMHQQTSAENSQQGNAPQQPGSGTPVDETQAARDLYNCMAWALGITDKWIEPARDDNGGYWVISNNGVKGKQTNDRKPFEPHYDDFLKTEVKPPNMTMFDMPRQFGGKKSSAEEAVTADSYKVIIFSNEKNRDTIQRSTHVMRQDADGTWSSKNGPGARYTGIKDPVAFYNSHYNKTGEFTQGLKVRYYNMPGKLLR